ncbi:unnamed protein product [Musa hybrid cultivar]
MEEHNDGPISIYLSSMILVQSDHTPKSCDQIMPEYNLRASRIHEIRLSCSTNDFLPLPDPHNHIQSNNEILKNPPS